MQYFEKSNGSRVGHRVRRLWSAVAGLTATALLSTLTTTPAHAGEISDYYNGPGSESITFKDLDYTIGADVSSVTYSYRYKQPDDYMCEANTSFLFDYTGVTSTQRTALHTMTNKILNNRRVNPNDTSSPIIKGSNGSFVAYYYGPGYRYSCPDFIRPSSASLPKTSLRRSDDSETVWWKTYTAVTYTYGFVATVGAALAYKLSPGYAIGATALIACIAGAMGQMIGGKVAGVDWKTRGTRMVKACVSDASAATLYMLSQTWHKINWSVLTEAAKAMDPYSYLTGFYSANPATVTSAALDQVA